MNPLNSNVYNVIQLSDCHLFANEKRKLLGLNTDYSLSLVLDQIQKEQLDIDLILITGDLSGDGSIDSYQRIKRKFDVLKTPVYWAKGNHDKINPTKQILKDDNYISFYLINFDPWHIIMLDSTISGKDFGEISMDDLEFLNRSLKVINNSYVIVCLHHPPIQMPNKWPNNQVINNSDKFFEVIDCYNNIKIITWGHTHRAFEGNRKGINLFSAPSTCVQYRLKNGKFVVDDQLPGYRWFELFEDGSMKSGVSRIQK